MYARSGASFGKALHFFYYHQPHSGLTWDQSYCSKVMFLLFFPVLLVSVGVSFVWHAHVHKKRATLRSWSSTFMWVLEPSIRCNPLQLTKQGNPGNCPSHILIRTLSARATAAFILANEHNVALFKHFADLLPGFLQVRTHL